MAARISANLPNHTSRCAFALAIGLTVLTLVISAPAQNAAASELGDTLSTLPETDAESARINKRLDACKTSPYVFEYKGVPLGSRQKCLRRQRLVSCSRIASATTPVDVEVCYLENQVEQTPFDVIAGKTVFPQYHYIDNRLYLVKLTMANPVEIDTVADYLSKVYGAPHAVDRAIVDVDGKGVEKFTLLWQRGTTQIRLNTLNENDRTATVIYYDLPLLDAAERKIKLSND